MSTTTITTEVVPTRDELGTAVRPNEESRADTLALGVKLEGIPHFDSFEKERKWMLEHMAAAFRVFARKGFTEGLAGHISLRDPEHKDLYWTNP